jgi:HemY protein
VLLTARGMEQEASGPEEARAAAQEAAKLEPGLVPAATLAARLFTRQGDIKRAVRVLETAWRHEPHPELAEAYGMVRAGDSALDRLKRAQRLATLRPGHLESRLAVARAAIDARDWPLARRELAAIDEKDRTERFCLLMAEIEEGPDGHRGHVREWLSRAVRAPRDPQWTADGYVFPAWAPISPITGRLDAFEWRTPTPALADDQRPAIDLVVADEEDEAPEPLVIEARETPAATTRTEPAPAPRVEVAETRPVPVASVNGTEETPVAVPPIPDDPGIEDAEPPSPDRLRLQ